MKVYQRKSGGGKFRPSGKSSSWGNQSTFAKPEEQAAAQLGIVSSVLQKMGFRVGPRGLK